MASNNSVVKQCVDLINEMENTVHDGKKSLLGGSDSCLISRSQMLQRIDQLRSSLPSAISTANEYVKNIQAIQQQADQDCAAQLRDAQQRASQMVAEAEQKAHETTSSAEQQADDLTRRTQAEVQATLDTARSEAMRIVEEAKRQAQAMVNQEEVLRRARVEADELRQRTQQETAQLRQNTFDYLDGILEQMDRRFSDTVTDLRMERNELNSHR